MLVCKRFVRWAKLNPDHTQEQDSAIFEKEQVAAENEHQRSELLQVTSCDINQFVMNVRSKSIHGSALIKDVALDGGFCKI